MDFDLSEEQRILKKTARDFLIKEVVRQLGESEEGYSPELWKKMAELGWTGLIFPEAYGGSGCSFLDLVILLEEMGYNLCPGPYFSAVVLGGLTILKAGTERQRKKFLPQMAAGQTISTLALTEPGGGYDAASIKVAATEGSEGYVIRGTKLFVPDAHLADYLLCAARTGNGVTPEEGITVFIVDAGSPGIHLRPLRTLAGDKQFEVEFDGVQVPEDRILGQVHQGWPVMEDTLKRAAAARGAEMIGGAQAAMEMAVEYARERIQFGRPIGSFQAVQHHVANMWLDIHGSRILVYKAAWKMSNGMPDDQSIAMAKARAGQAYRNATLLAHQIFGAIGFTMEHDLHLYHRRAAASDLAFGGSDFQRERVARALGL
jgi:alkylation response protein AidB-like acyl-CoA dehydrogenase